MIRIIDTDYIIRNVSLSEAIERYTGARLIHNKYFCPFHNDKNPSLSVKNGKYRCWACGASGNVINFVSRYCDIGFKDTCRKLSADFNLNLDIDDKPKRFDIWDEVKRESDLWHKQQKTIIREQLEAEINAYTIAHRALFHAGAPKEKTDFCIKRLDELEYQKELWR